MKDISIFVERLKELMKEGNLNNLRLSKKIDCQDQAIANWLEGKYFPSLSNLLSLSAYFKCSIDFILGLTDDEHFTVSANTATFTERYKLCLSKTKLTGYRIAKLCNIEQSTISQWINNGRMPEAGNLIALSKIFDCSVEYLLGRADD